MKNKMLIAMLSLSMAMSLVACGNDPKTPETSPAIEESSEEENETEASVEEEDMTVEITVETDGKEEVTKIQVDAELNVISFSETSLEIAENESVTDVVARMAESEDYRDSNITINVKSSNVMDAKTTAKLLTEEMRQKMHQDGFAKNVTVALNDRTICEVNEKTVNEEVADDSEDAEEETSDHEEVADDMTDSEQTGENQAADNASSGNQTVAQNNAVTTAPAANGNNTAPQQPASTPTQPATNNNQPNAGTQQTPAQNQTQAPTQAPAPQETTAAPEPQTEAPQTSYGTYTANGLIYHGLKPGETRTVAGVTYTSGQEEQYDAACQSAYGRHCEFYTQPYSSQEREMTERKMTEIMAALGNGGPSSGKWTFITSDDEMLALFGLDRDAWDNDKENAISNGTLASLVSYMRMEDNVWMSLVTTGSTTDPSRIPFSSENVSYLGAKSFYGVYYHTMTYSFNPSTGIGTYTISFYAT